MSIRVGIGSGATAGMTPDAYWRWVEMCEEDGLDSIWHSDQLLGPNFEPMAMTAALAARTSRLRIGMSALVVPFREPIVVAKQIATIDYLSGGRLLPVFGVGMTRDPYWAATGRSAADRGSRSNEGIALIRALLEQEEVVFRGDHYRYEGPGVWPRPAKPIPLWIGGESEAAIRRTAIMGDGWLGGLAGIDTVREVVARIRQELAVSDRRIDDDHYGATVLFRIGTRDDPAVEAMRRRFATADLPAAVIVGDADALVRHFHALVAAGVAKFVAIPIVDNANDLIDQTQLLAREVIVAIENR